MKFKYKFVDVIDLAHVRLLELLLRYLFKQSNFLDGTAQVMKILLIDSIEPQTYYKLPGTSQEIAAKHLKIESKPILLESVHEYDHVFALNTLGGMISVSAIGDVVFDTEHETARKITDIILELN